MLRRSVAICFTGQPTMSALEIGQAMLRKKRDREQAANTVTYPKREWKNHVELDFSKECEELNRLYGKEVGVHVTPNIINEDEAHILEIELENHLNTKRWESSHADVLIQGFREKFVPQAEVSREAEGILSRYLHDINGFPFNKEYHFLEYTPDGFVKPHTDTKNTAHFVAGICLFSTRVMRLTPPSPEHSPIELFLPPRSRYVLSGPSRYNWLHGIDYIEGTDVHKDVHHLYYKNHRLNIPRTKRGVIISRGDRTFKASSS
eukprot:TRINITY_DN24975_c0_g1_i1.p1 TRINITY_DN24975_c0_g1~~TRINITY_DN24975_c0_g1_i1.p1  ORF type:complete len:284 (+),score=32.23 TRINITY_DN24975_c0_g1_i1:67-852(+)